MPDDVTTQFFIRLAKGHGVNAGSISKPSDSWNRGDWEEYFAYRNTVKRAVALATRHYQMTEPKPD